MEFYNDPEKVDKYEKMCDEYDGTELYKILENHLMEKSSVLELGCGPSNDINYLKNKFNITGSDLSDEFIKRGKERFPDVKFVKLDAVKIELEETFDCLFSNKVLHHLKPEELEVSLKRQQTVIKENGLFVHTFWIGDKEFTMEGMLFVFYNRDRLIKLISKYFSIIETYDYKEFEDGDSILIVAKNNKSA